MPPRPSSPRAIDAILFDLDGTLVDSAPAMTRGLNEMAARRGVPPVDVASVRSWVSLGGEAMLRGALGDRMDSERDLDEFRDILRHQTADPADLYPGVSAVLNELKQSGYRLAVCTNKREDIAIPYLAGLGIGDNFDVVVGGAEGRLLKPDPEMVFIALEQLGAAADEAIFVGDSEIDAETAAAAGLPFLLVTFGYPHGQLREIAATIRLNEFGSLLTALG